MPKEKEYKNGTIGERIVELIEAKEKAGGHRIFDKMIADYAGISQSHFSKIKNGKIKNPDESVLKKIAEFLDTTAYELRYGVSAENSHIYTKVPLSDNALTWLNTNLENTPELVQLLNLILSNKPLADNFFRHLLLYVKETDLQAELRSTDDIVLDKETSEEISRLLLLNSIIKLMEQLKRIWREIK